MICPICDVSRKPPGDPKTEQLVLSCIMQSPETAVDAALQMLKPEDFAAEASALLFDLVCRRHGEGLPVDPVSLMGYLYEKGLMDKIGGPGWVSETYSACPAPTRAHLLDFAGQVLTASKRRRMVRIATELARAALGGSEGDTEPEDWRDAVLPLLRKADACIMDGKGAELIPVKDVVLQYADAYEARMLKDLDAPVATGIKALDKLMDGGIRREYVLIGGRQGHGKTLLAMQMAGALANGGRRGLVIGYEMTAMQILMRDLARETGIPLNQIMGRREIEGQYALQTITRGLSRIGEHWDVYYTESPYITLETVAAHARSLHRVKPLDFLVIDYLQLVPMKRAGKERSDEALVSLSNQVERLRKELGCTLIAPVQLNDDGLIRDARGILDAPQVFIRIEMEEVTNDEGALEAGDNGFLKFLKNRFGNNNRSCPVFRNGSLQRFEDREHSPKPKQSPRRTGRDW